MKFGVFWSPLHRPFCIYFDIHPVLFDSFRFFFNFSKIPLIWIWFLVMELISWCLHLFVYSRNDGPGSNTVDIQCEIDVGFFFAEHQHHFKHIVFGFSCQLFCRVYPVSMLDFSIVINGWVYCGRRFEKGGIVRLH